MLVRPGDVVARQELAAFVIDRHDLVDAGEPEVAGAAADFAGLFAAVLRQHLAAGTGQFDGLARRKAQTLGLVSGAGAHDLAGRARNAQQALRHHGLEASGRVAGAADGLDPVCQGQLHAVDRQANVGQHLVAGRVADDLCGSRVGHVGREHDVGTAADDRAKRGREVGLTGGIELELVHAIEPQVDAALQSLDAAGEGVVPGEHGIRHGREAESGRGAEEDDALAAGKVAGGFEQGEMLLGEAEVREVTLELLVAVEVDAHRLAGGRPTRGDGQFLGAQARLHGDLADLATTPLVDIEPRMLLDVVHHLSAELGGQGVALDRHGVDDVHDAHAALERLHLRAARASRDRLAQHALGGLVHLEQRIVLAGHLRLLAASDEEHQVGRGGVLLCLALLGPFLELRDHREPELLARGHLLVAPLPVPHQDAGLDQQRDEPARERDEQADGDGDDASGHERRVDPTEATLVEVERGRILLDLRRDQPGIRGVRGEREHRRDGIQQDRRVADGQEGSGHGVQAHLGSLIVVPGGVSGCPSGAS